MSFRFSTLFFLFAAFLAGCGDPPLNSISGRVTLDGQPYERLIVYFHPTFGKVNEFNLGVGETDADGNLTLRSTAGDGLQRGKYRVSFSCVVTKGGKGEATGLSDQKNDENRRLVTEELVPDEYFGEGSTVEYTVKSGENVFEFDIPTKS